METSGTETEIMVFVCGFSLCTKFCSLEVLVKHELVATLLTHALLTCHALLGMLPYSSRLAKPL